MTAQLRPYTTPARLSMRATTIAAAAFSDIGEDERHHARHERRRSA